MTSPMTEFGELLMKPQPRKVIVPAVGIHPGISDDVYHRQWEAASNSRLSLLRHSPAHLKAYIDNPPVETPSKQLGRAVHRAILEPELFTSEYVVAEQCQATKKGDGLRCQNAGVVRSNGTWFCGVHGKGLASDVTGAVLPADSYEACIRIRDAVHVHSAARHLLTGVGGESEVSIAWIDPETGLLCKARLDGHNHSLPGGVLVDVKSTMDASELAFMRSIWEYGYHRQGSHYLQGSNAVGLEARHFLNIAVEKEPPYAVGVYRLIESAIDAGRDQLRPLKRRYAECLKTDTWPAYSDEVRDISLPDFAWKQLESELMGAGV